MNFEVSV